MAITAKHSIDETHGHCVSASVTLARFARTLQASVIPEMVRTRALHLMLDAVGVAIASRGYPFAERLRTGLSSLGGPGSSTVIGSPDGLPLRDAATLNGALIHGLDFDDTHLGAVVHATAVSLPTALAIGELVDASGSEILTAYVIAMEAAIRIGLTSQYGFHAAGYHATGVAGHFSSALAAARMLGLNESQIENAQGLVLSTATASREYWSDGAWNKRLHPGWAAVAGITAAFLARDGFIGARRPYDGQFGLFPLHLGKEEAARLDYTTLTRGLGTQWMLMDAAIKPFPSCHYTHALIDSSIAIREAHAPQIDQIDRIRILVPEETLTVLSEPTAIKQSPDSEYAAKFSAPYTVACGLARGRLGLAELEPKARADAEILALSARCHCEPDPDSSFPEYFSGGVIVELKDGRTLRHHERINRGAGDRQLSHEEICAKFRDNVSDHLNPSRAQALMNAVIGLEGLSGRTFGDALRAA